MTTYGISGGPIENFREGWALLPFVGGHCKPHYWRRHDLTNFYLALCGLKGALATREALVAAGIVNAQHGHRPLAPGVFIAERCKLCNRKHHKQVAR